MNGHEGTIISVHSRLGSLKRALMTQQKIKLMSVSENVT